jgi:hypothetical protein
MAVSCGRGSSGGRGSGGPIHGSTRGRGCGRGPRGGFSNQVSRLAGTNSGSSASPMPVVPEDQPFYQDLLVQVRGGVICRVA